MGILVRLGMLLRLGWRSLARNRIRTLLTMLGIIIGVASVIAIVALGNGSQERLEKEMEGIGINSIEIEPSEGSARSHAGLTETDAEEVKSNCPSVSLSSAMVWQGDRPIVYANQNVSAFVLGISPDFLAIHKYRMAAGECFTEDDVRNAARVCVLGTKTADALFGNRSAIGRVVRVKSVTFKVVGIKASNGAQGGYFRDEDAMFLAPYTAVGRYIRHWSGIDEITVATASPLKMNDAKNEVRAFLRQHHHIHGSLPDDFELDDIEAAMERWQARRKVFSTLLGGVASISLLVGGIGIMNIMLVTVTERIREIGTRMAIGARPSDIMLQFLIEALTMSVSGGLLGIGLGVALAAVVDKKWSTAIVSLDSIVLAFGVSCAIGVFFGFWPAYKASRLDPIQALRHE